MAQIRVDFALRQRGTLSDESIVEFLKYLSANHSMPLDYVLKDNVHSWL
jgi:hypothetical protein